MSKQIYVAPLPENAQRRRTQGQQARRNVSEDALLNQDAASVEPISAEPGTTRLDGQYRGRFAEIMAAELRELAESDGFGTVPYFTPGGKTATDGYYAIRDIDAKPATPNVALVQDYEGSITREGTRDSHLRAVETTPRTLSQPFGSDTTALVSAPAAATDVRWVNPTTAASETASPLATHTAELGDVRTYDLGDASFWSPTTQTTTYPVLVYDIQYGDIGPVDVRVWDTRGFADRDDADGLPQWQKVFVSTHNFADDAAVVSNGRRRVTLDPSATPGLTVEEYDTAAGQWSPLPLGTSGNAGDWSLRAFDIARRDDQTLGPTRVDVLTRWESTSGATHPLDMTLRRGAGSLQFAQLPDATSAVPSGLVSLLDPVASTRIIHPTSVQTIRPRDKVGES